MDLLFGSVKGFGFGIPFKGFAAEGLAQLSGWWTLGFSAIATVGFFGLDEVAEILESPFGNDPRQTTWRLLCRFFLAMTCSFIIGIKIYYLERQVA